MRILYGVQATGQGHISRARAMAGALFRPDSGMAPWLMRPVTVKLARRAPF